MHAKPLLRDLALLALAATLGWWGHTWARGANIWVHAQRSSTHASDPSTPGPADSLAFQYGGLGPDGQLTLYNPNNHMLYVYPSIGRSSNSHINCLYSVRVDHPGAPLDRENCPVGSFFPH